MSEKKIIATTTVTNGKIEVEPAFVKTNKYRELERKYFKALEEIEQLKSNLNDCEDTMARINGDKLTLAEENERLNKFKTVISYCPHCGEEIKIRIEV